jgi:hypothetical protein
MPTNISLAWATLGTVTFTPSTALQSLANNSNSVASDTIDITTQTPILDMLLQMRMNTQSLVSGGSIYLYALPYNGLGGAFTSPNDGEYTLVGAATLSAVATQEQSSVFSLARCFGGILPPQVKFIMRNETGGTLSSVSNASNIFYSKVYATQT